MIMIMDVGILTMVFVGYVNIIIWRFPEMGVPLDHPF